MGLRPTEVYENLFEPRRVVDTVGSGAVGRVFPVYEGGFSTLPQKCGEAATELGRLTLRNRRYKVARARPIANRPQDTILPHISKSSRAARSG